ncbi:MAG: HAD-IIIC family phosphatase [bacterium]
MPKRNFRSFLISDFTINNFAGYLNNDNDFPPVSSTIAPFGQVISVLIDKNLECWNSDPDFAVIWTQPESVIESFNHILNYKRVSIDEIIKEVDEYSSILMNIQDKVNIAFVPTWVLPSYHRGFGVLDMKNRIGIANILMRMNLRLSDNLDKASNIYLLNTQKWIEIAGSKAFNPKLWYLGKIAFGNEVFKEAVKDIKSALRGFTGRSIKLIILDLDDTLWGGIVGDLGWQNIKLGGHDPIGEAYVDFQKALKSLTNRGILLGIVSKNEESVALDAINKHPEMVLGLEDIAGWKINWHDKAQNIVDLVSDLNLGLQSVIFIDDNPVERARVRETLPEVFVPEWPEDKMLYKRSLISLRCFDTPSISNEDFKRTKMYVSERQRRSSRSQVGSLDEWLNTLKMKVKIEELNETNLQRTCQLLNKTNQMNLSTRRMTESELVGWVKQAGCKLWTFRVSDKFGDSGLTGIISLEVENKKGKIVDFVLSCRVMGRKIEETMLYQVIQYAQFKQLDEIYAKYIPTPKNKPCLEFWNRSGFIYTEKDSSFIWKVKKDYALPTCIQIDRKE